MSQPPPQPPTSGNPSTGPLSVQSILNPTTTDPSTARPEAARPPPPGHRPSAPPPPPPQFGPIPPHPLHQQQHGPPAQQLPSIRAEPLSSSSSATSFSPRERHRHPRSGYPSYRDAPPQTRPGEGFHEPRRSLPMPNIGPMIPEVPEPPPSFPAGMQSGNYQMMSYTTASGQNVTVPVDVHAASRVADEKRRRNAGASARFRARRKERETESSRVIDDMKQQMQEIQEDMEFYRSERDYLLPLIQDRERHLPRPVSPSRRRPRSLRPPESGPSPPYPGPYSRPSPAYEEYGDRSSTERHTRRRLTTDYGAEYGQGAIPPPPSGYSYGPSQQSQQYVPREEPARPSYDLRRPAPPEAGPSGLQPPLPPPQQHPHQRDYRENPPQGPYRKDWPPPQPPPPPDRHRR